MRWGCSVLDVGALYEEHRARIWKYTRARLSGRVATNEDVDDIVQRVFEKAAAGAPAYEDRGFDPFQWLSTIAWHLSIDYLKQRRFKYRYVPVNEASNRSREPVRETDPDRPFPSLPVERLREEYQEVLRIKYADDVPLPEAALRMGVPYTTLQKRHTRALTELRQLMGVAS
jgi:RNA polymerase sigma factor (sigma-70 family)